MNIYRCQMDAEVLECGHLIHSAVFAPHFIGTALALGLAAATAGGSIASGAIASHGAGKAANTAASADVQAAQINKQAQDAALAFQREQQAEATREYNQNQSNIAPWLTAGQDALKQLSSMTGRQADFVAPTQEEAANDQGYQFTLAQGMKALQSSAAAKGGLLTTGTLKNLTDYGQAAGANQYNNVYSRDLTTYNTNRQNTTDSFNRLAALAGVGQQASQQIAGLPNPYSGNQTAQIDLTGGANQANAYANAGAARASGYQNSGNIWGNAFSNSSQMPFNLYALNQLGKSSSGNNPYPYFGAPYAPGVDPYNRV